VRYFGVQEGRPKNKLVRGTGRDFLLPRGHRLRSRDVV
jgi:hypothetical protein